jgi:hypothetical protein
MNKLTTTILTVLLLASSAMAKIGETAEQIIKTAQHDKDAISSHAYTWEGKPALNITYKDGSIIRHLFGFNKREIAFYLFSAKRLTGTDITKIQRQFHIKWYTDNKPDDGLYFWLSENSKLAMTAKRMEKFDYLCIFDLTKATEIPGNRSDTVAEPSVLPTPSSGQDCLIIATDALSRLKDHAYWARIAGFQVFKKSEKVGGHAVVFFQPTETSNIYMYDKSGSLELPTSSHDLEVVIWALNEVVSKLNYNIEDSKWIGEEVASPTPSPEQKELQYSKGYKY